MRILIADDDALSRRLLEKTLERAGYDVIAVENGRLAVEHLCQPDGPRLALLDWIMPELDGPAVCREVRQKRQEPYVHLVLLTSKESKGDIVAGLESGADDYLVKPFDAEELTARLRTGLRILQLEDKLVEARESMRFKATYDPLTGLYNRGVILDLLTRELSRTRREEGCTAVMMGDVDHFKSINDSRGHLVGDEVLKEIARRILAAVRSYDFVGRYGGEEFLIVLNKCNDSYSMLRAEEIRRAIAMVPVQTEQGPMPITMSLGVLSSKEWGLRPVSEILQEVDIALYKAKGAGRNCVMLANPPQGPGLSTEPIEKILGNKDCTPADDSGNVSDPIVGRT
jgi:two-component system cell cycle response regulator